MTEKPTDRKATPEEAEDLKMAHLRDKFFQVDNHDPTYAVHRANLVAEIGERAAKRLERKAERHYWTTVHAFAQLMEAMPLPERIAWVNWLDDRFIRWVKE